MNKLQLKSNGDLCLKPHYAVANTIDKDDSIKKLSFIGSKLNDIHEIFIEGDICISRPFLTIHNDLNEMNGMYFKITYKKEAYDYRGDYRNPPLRGYHIKEIRRRLRRA